VQSEQYLEGIKVVEFSAYIMTPLLGKILGEYGAEVIKVESKTHPDVFRVSSPFPDGKPGINRSGLFSHLNPYKYSISLNLTHPKAVEILNRLVHRADIFLDGFSPGTVAKWGLAYEDLSKVKPDIIMVSGSMQGQTGPLAKQRGMGSLMQAMVGFIRATGQAEQAPQTSLTPYPDFISPWYALVGVISALEHRRETGKGTYLDISQIEAGPQFLSSMILDYTANGRAARSTGNRASFASPHNAYHCKGEDRWCTIAVFDEDEWLALCSAMEKPELANDPRFSTFLARKLNEDELDQLIGEWTIGQSPQEIKTTLQKAGVTADVMSNGDGLSQEPYFRESGFCETIDHPEMGRITSFRSSFTLSENPVKMRRSPLLGEDTEHVATKILGITDEEFINLLNEGVFE
jgi:benzylsuccinate CoA-transferase BbsF subunit